jgi:hypothetical protein
MFPESVADTDADLQLVGMVRFAPVHDEVGLHAAQPLAGPTAIYRGSASLGIGAPGRGLTGLTFGQFCGER